MAAVRDGHTATLLANGKVLIVGGMPEPSSIPDWTDLTWTELYDPHTGKFTRTGATDRYRPGHSATLLPDGKVLIAGGGGGWPVDTATAELYDAGTGSFSGTGSMSVTREHHTATLLANGKVLITGGGGMGFLATAELYDPHTGSFSATGPMVSATGPMVSAHWGQTATLLPSGAVLIAGDLGGDVTLPAAAELYVTDRP